MVLEMTSHCFKEKKTRTVSSFCKMQMRQLLILFTEFCAILVKDSSVYL